MLAFRTTRRYPFTFSRPRFLFAELSGADTETHPVKVFLRALLVVMNEAAGWATFSMTARAFCRVNILRRKTLATEISSRYQRDKKRKKKSLFRSVDLDGTASGTPQLPLVFTPEDGNVSNISLFSWEVVSSTYYTFRKLQGSDRET